MRYLTLSQARAHEILDLMDPPTNATPSIADREVLSGTGDVFDRDVYTRLAEELAILQEGFGTDTLGFDAEAAVVVHAAMPEDIELLSDDGFWRWLALGPLQRITATRFPAGSRRRGGGDESEPRLNRSNFGVGGSARERAECYPYKLWLRGELGRVEDGERYRFVKRGDVDFWTSHIHRQTYTTNRRLCSALIRFQYPDAREGRPRLIPGVERADRRGVRTLAKRIRRLQATCELAVLTDGDLEALVAELAVDLTLAA